MPISRTISYPIIIIPRHIENTLAKLVTGYPVITITGPRQSGKTTLARSFFSEKPYVSLENPDVREEATNDPRTFLADIQTVRFSMKFSDVRSCSPIFSRLLTRDRKHADSS